MTIDERLEALTARHEALAQTVELIAAMQRDNERLQRDNEQAQKERNVRIDQLHGEMMLAIARLANTAAAHNGHLAEHEERIDHPEGK